MAPRAALEIQQTEEPLAVEGTDPEAVEVPLGLQQVSLLPLTGKLVVKGAHFSLLQHQLRPVVGQVVPRILAAATEAMQPHTL